MTAPHRLDANVTRPRVRLAYFVLGQLGWLVCVVSAARGYGWIGCAAVAVLAAGHLRLTRHPAREARFVILVTLLGWIWESIMRQTGFITYPSGGHLSWAAPYWMAGLWALFALQINTLLYWLRPYPLLGALLGAVGGALSFRAGALLGAVHFVHAGYAYALLATGWAVILPGLIWLGATLCQGHAEATTEPRS